MIYDRPHELLCKYIRLPWHAISFKERKLTHVSRPMVVNRYTATSFLWTPLSGRWHVHLHCPWLRRRRLRASGYILHFDGARTVLQQLWWPPQAEAERVVLDMRR